MGGGGMGGRGGGMGGGGMGGRGGGMGGGGMGGGQPGGGDNGDGAANDKTVPSEPVTAGTLNALAPLPKHTEPQLHPEGYLWYRLLVTFDVELVPQPRAVSNESEGQ